MGMENTVLACLPTSYSLSDQSKRLEVYHQLSFRYKVLQALFKCIEEAFEPISRHPFIGSSTRTNCAAWFRYHFVMNVSYVPESKDILSVRQAVLTQLSFPRFATLKYIMYENYQSPFRNVKICFLSYDLFAA